MSLKDRAHKQGVGDRDPDHDLAVCVGIAVLGSVLRNRAAIICLIGGALLILGPIVAYLPITIPPHALWQSFFEFPNNVQLAARHIPLHFLKHDILGLLSLVLLPLAIMAFAATRPLRGPASGPLATRHYMWMLGVTNSLPVQSEIVKGLKSNNVQYVVLFDAPTSAEENLSSVDSGITLLDDYLKRNYREVAVSRRYHILQRVF